MSIFYLSIGSNISPQENIPKSITALKKTFPSHVFSSIYETEPVGPSGTENFWNLAAKIETELTQKSLLEKLREIESKLGRVRSSNKFAPRTIDIDILPQENYQTFAFIIVPLAEIDSEGIDPETGKTFGELAGALKNKSAGIQKI